MKLCLAIFGVVFFFYVVDSIPVDYERELGTITRLYPVSPISPFTHQLAKETTLEKKIQNDEKTIEEYFPSTHQNESRLRSFVNKMRSFVDGRMFDVHGFTMEKDNLKTELSELKRLIQGIHLHKELSSQLVFAERMFEKMDNSAQMLRLYTSSKVRGSRLVYKVIELGVRALALNDSRGRLDIRNSEAAKRLLYLRDCLVFWNMQFAMLTGVPQSTRDFFEDQVKKAEYSLQLLRSDVPQYER